MRRRTRQEQQAETRRQILEAAARVFARSGYRGASVEQIADEAGFSHGAVYSNFAGKEALFLAVYEERILRRQDEIESAGGAGAERAAADAWMERLRDDPDYFLLYLEFVVHAARDDATRATFAAQTSLTRSTITRLVEQLAERRGVALPADADRLALSIRALGLGLAIEHLLDPDAVPADLYGDVVELLLDRRLAS